MLKTQLRVGQRQEGHWGLLASSLARCEPQVKDRPCHSGGGREDGGGYLMPSSDPHGHTGAETYTHTHTPHTFTHMLAHTQNT